MGAILPKILFSTQGRKVAKTQGGESFIMGKRLSPKSDHEAMGFAC